MILAYVAFREGASEFARLAVVPEDQSRYATPVSVDLLFQSDSAVFWIGPKEAITVQLENDGASKVIRPVPPAKLFLTPDDPNRPGVRGTMARVDYPDDGPYRIWFKKDLTSDWTSWEPLVQVR